MKALRTLPRSGQIALVIVVVAAVIGFVIDAAVTSYILLGLLLLVTAIAYALAAFRRRPLVGGVILLAALLNRPLESVIESTPVSHYMSLIDDATLAFAIPFVLAGLLYDSKKDATTGHSWMRRFASNLTSVGWIVWVGFGLFALSGTLGHLIAGTHLRALPMGSWLALKLPLSLFIMVALRWTPRAIQRLLHVLLAVLAIQVVAVVAEYLVPDAVHAVFGTVNGADREGLLALKGIFNHPVQSATFCVFLASALIAGPVSKPLRIGGYVAGGVGAAGLRVKTLIDLAAIAVVRIFFGLSSRARLIALGCVVIGALGVGFFAFDLISARFSAVVGSGTSPRARLLQTGWQIALAHAPFGSGFGTFGTETSRSMYSPVWEQYGLADDYGFRRNNPAFITDLSWAAVLGETGFLGIIGMIVALGALAWPMLRDSYATRSPSWSLAASAFLATFVIDSFASPRLFDGFAVAALGALIAFHAMQKNSQGSEVTA